MMSSTYCPVGRSLILSVDARSVIAPVGTPPPQKNASIVPSRIASTDSSTPSCSLSMPASGSTPASVRILSVLTSVAELGVPTSGPGEVPRLDRIHPRNGQPFFHGEGHRPRALEATAGLQDHQRGVLPGGEPEGKRRGARSVIGDGEGL